MPTPILMPALSPTMEAGKLAKWHVREGDPVKSGAVIAEIETDKATMEIEAVDEGVVGRILVPAGTEDVKVNAPIALLLGEGEDEAALASFEAPSGPPKPLSDSPQPSPIQAAPAQAAPQPPPAAAQAVPGPQPAPAQAAPEVQPAPAQQLPPAASGPAKAAPDKPERRKANGEGRRAFASPLARRLARDAGIDLSRLSGSGPHGRVVKQDVEKAQREGVPGAAAPRLAPALGDEAILKLFEADSFEVVPHDSMRKTIARRLTEAKQSIPHFYLSLDCALDRLLTVREEMNASAPKDPDGKPRWRLSVNDFVIKALAQALVRVPEANVTWTEAAMLKHRRADVGVAVAIPGGLITPVVRNAERKGLAQISAEMRDFAARARARKLLPHEYQGGSTAVSNLGMYGIKAFSAVINPPHATILAVGAGERRAVVEGDAVTVRTMMTATLSTDHRAVDGALGAELLQAFKACIEEPAMLAV